jgi:hypothetical protein
MLCIIEFENGCKWQFKKEGIDLGGFKYFLLRNKKQKIQSEELAFRPRKSSWPPGLHFFLICMVGRGVESRSTRHCGHLMAYCASPGWLWWWRNRWNDWQGKPKYSEKTCPSAALSTTNPACRPYANPGRRGGKPASNRWPKARPVTSRIWSNSANHWTIAFRHFSFKWLQY